MNTTIVRRGIRKVLARSLPVTLAILLAAPPFPRAQQPGPAAAPFKPEQLEQIVAPIALYPDPLLAQIFMASTYPLEIVQASRFAQANASLKEHGDQRGAQEARLGRQREIAGLVSPRCSR